MAKVLVVDDDPAVQMVVGLVLEQADHAVVIAGDGSKGLAACATVTQCLKGETQTSSDRNVASGR